MKVDRLGRPAIDGVRWSPTGSIEMVEAPMTRAREERYDHDDRVSRTLRRRLRGSMPSACWCGDSVVWVSAPDFAHGVTGSCARSDCEPGAPLARRSHPPIPIRREVPPGKWAEHARRAAARAANRPAELPTQPGRLISDAARRRAEALDRFEHRVLKAWRLAQGAPPEGVGTALITVWFDDGRETSVLVPVPHAYDRDEYGNLLLTDVVTGAFIARFVGVRDALLGDRLRPRVYR